MSAPALVERDRACTSDGYAIGLAGQRGTVEMSKRKTRSISFSSATVARMGRGDYVSLEVIDKICVALDCGIGDVVMRDYCTEKSPDA